MLNKKKNALEIGLAQHGEIPAEHKGMPAKEPQPQKSLVEKQITQHDTSSEASLHLPHERDQSTSMTATGRAPIIEQAFKDEERGLEDTSKQAEMDEAYNKLKGEQET